jgi:parallel beta-helix repeat protein
MKPFWKFKDKVKLLLFLTLTLSIILSYALYDSSRSLEAVRQAILLYNASFASLRNIILQELYNKCGGILKLRGNATGFFHIEKIGGVWWIVDPEGNAFISKGVNHVSYQGDYAPTLGYSPYNRAVSKIYGDAESWARSAVDRLRKFGFNTIGAWSSDEVFTKGMPYTIILDIASTAGSEWLSGEVTDFFSSSFEEAAQKVAERACTPRKDDPNLLGYFTDNELRWSPDWRSSNHIFDDYLSLERDAPGKRALVKFLEEKYVTIDSLNAKWGTAFRSFEDLLDIYELPQVKSLDSDRLGFLGVVAKRYFQVCHDAIKRHDPNHLILGCRFAFQPPDEVLKSCIGFLDVISINNYDFEPPLEVLRRINSLTGLPIILTEFSFKAMDSGLPNTKGAGTPLETQKDRAYHYEEYVRKLVSEPYVVGYHWFEYADEPAEGRFDGENSNYGLVNINDEPWTMLVTGATSINLLAEHIHAESSGNVTLFYVSPNGDDHWSGRIPNPNPSKTDGPFSTIERARDAVRELKRKRGLEKPVTIFIRGGHYFLKKPLILTVEDSGTDSSPITYSAYPGESPVISGGRSITGWKREEVDGKEMWTVEIEEAKEHGWFFRELWIDGQRRFRARHPNEGYLLIADLPDVTERTTLEEGQERFVFGDGDLRAWAGASDAEIVVMNRWVESHLPIVSVEEKSRIVTFGKRSVFRLETGDPYYVENALEMLDEPGEWYLDGASGKLYYLPMPNEDLERAEVIGPFLPQLLRLEGEPEKGKFVEHVAFIGLTFAHTEWSLPPDASGFLQASVGVPASIYCEGIRYCSFEGCTISHIGTYAIELSRGCHENTISRCTLFDLGAGGLKIGEQTIRREELEQTKGNLVSDCFIYNGGLIFHSAVGIWIGQSYGNLIAHNDIHDFYYTGISVGWTWGYGRSLAKDNVIEFNNIHHIGVRTDGRGPILSDIGGIYTLGIQPGTTIRFNVFHDIAGFRYGGWGIYLDEGSTNILVEGNIVYRTTHGGFHQHYGRENIIRNNIFALGRDAQIQRTRSEDHLSFRFERNIVYWSEGDLLVGNLDNLNFFFDRNLYWQEGGGEVKFGKFSWDEWRGMGMDANSLIADPLFMDVGVGNFALNSSSCAFSLGFKPIDLDKVGPRQPSA